MRPDTYHRGVPGKKYGIWNCSTKCFQFNIREDTPMLAMARLHQKLGHDAKKWRFEPRMLPDPRREEQSKVTEKTLQVLDEDRNVVWERPPDPVEYAPIRHAKWEYGSWENGHWVKGHDRCRCSVCQRDFAFDPSNIWNGCPHCLARMMEE